MRLGLLIPVLMISLNCFASSTEQLRKAFHNSVLNPHELPVFLEALSTIQFPSPLEEAYIGAAHALIAREGWNPVSKVNHLSNFRKILAGAIEKDANNIEIRFLRYSIEFNVPKLLRSEDNMVADKAVIMSNIDKTNTLNIDDGFIIYILTLFEDTKNWTSEEIDLIKKKLLD